MKGLTALPSPRSRACREEGLRQARVISPRGKDSLRLCRGLSPRQFLQFLNKHRVQGTPGTVCAI